MLSLWLCVYKPPSPPILPSQAVPCYGSTHSVSNAMGTLGPVHSLIPILLVRFPVRSGKPSGSESLSHGGCKYVRAQHEPSVPSSQSSGCHTTTSIHFRNMPPAEIRCSAVCIYETLNLPGRLQSIENRHFVLT